MAQVVYNDDSGEGLALLREHATSQGAYDDAERLNGLLETVLRAGQVFRYDAAQHGEDVVAAYCAVYEATPEWALLQSEFPDFFTSADDVGLYAYWPTIDSED